MEYTFRNSAHEEETTLVLDDYTFSFRKGERVEVISYASITSVRIIKSSDNVFKIHLSADGHGSIVIASQSLTKNGVRLDQSAGYVLFVRVLHHHLKDKSQAIFTSGGNSDRIWQWAAGSAVFSFCISIAGDYLGFSLINPFIQALIFAALTAIMIIVFSVRKLSRSYNPGNIPSQFLP